MTIAEMVAHLREGAAVVSYLCDSLATEEAEQSWRTRAEAMTKAADLVERLSAHEEYIASIKCVSPGCVLVRDHEGDCHASASGCQTPSGPASLL
jgi:hypothetical protein